MAQNITTIQIKVNIHKLALGHVPHRSGAGKHLDKRTKRTRTRGAAFRKAIDA